MIVRQTNAWTMIVLDFKNGALCSGSDSRENHTPIITASLTVNERSTLLLYNSNSSKCIAVHGNSHATWDHTVLPATRQR